MKLFIIVFSICFILSLIYHRIKRNCKRKQFTDKLVYIKMLIETGLMSKNSANFIKYEIKKIYHYVNSPVDKIVVENIELKFQEKFKEFL